MRSFRDTHLASLFAIVGVACTTGPLLAAPASPAGPTGKEILKHAIAVPTVEGRGKVKELADYFATILRGAGYKDSEMVWTPIGETGIFTVTLKGRDASAKPILVNGHMDVVEAKAEDWTRDPFTPVEEGGYIFGRGSEDNKYDVSLIVATMAKLKRENYVPRQDLVMVLTGDEETHMRTAAAAAQTWRNAEMFINGDGGGGLLDEQGQPTMYLLQAGEKTYADFTVTLTDPGGHSSAPTATNPIYRMGHVLARLEAYKFPPMQNELTRASLTVAAESFGAEVGSSIRAFLANPRDNAAADKISTLPELIGQVRTTCVATMMSGGHALNALPQRASININCRIFPGVSVDSVKAELTKVIADPSAKIETVDQPTSSDASPLRPDVVKAVTAAVQARYPGIRVVPAMSAGATDSLYFRALGVPSYGVSTLFMKPDDGFAHGLNERVPSGGIEAAQKQWYDLLKALTK